MKLFTAEDILDQIEGGEAVEHLTLDETDRFVEKVKTVLEEDGLSQRFLEAYWAEIDEAIDRVLEKSGLLTIR